MLERRRQAKACRRANPTRRERAALRKFGGSVNGINVVVDAVDIAVDRSHMRASSRIDIIEGSGSVNEPERDGNQKVPQNELGVSRLDSTREAGESESVGVATRCALAP